MRTDPVPASSPRPCAPVHRSSNQALEACWGLSCQPNGHWSARDVFAYLNAHDLPVHPAYAMTFGGALDRGRLRVGTIGGSRGTEFGRAEWEAAHAWQGRAVCLSTGPQSISGVVLGVDDRGALRLMCEGEERVYSGGELSLRLSDDS